MGASGSARLYSILFSLLSPSWPEFLKMHAIKTLGRPCSRRPSSLKLVPGTFYLLKVYLLSRIKLRNVYEWGCQSCKLLSLRLAHTAEKTACWGCGARDCFLVPGIRQLPPDRQYAGGGNPRFRSGGFVNSISHNSFFKLCIG